MPKKLNPGALSDKALELIAERFRLLSEPARLKLLAALQQREQNVSELVHETGLTQANVSRHLMALADAGVVARRKEGVRVYYRISDPAVFDLCHHVCGSLHERFLQQGQSASLFSA